jgi:hypothetical protein
MYFRSNVGLFYRASTTFTMPNKAITITANFELIPRKHRKAKIIFHPNGGKGGTGDVKARTTRKVENAVTYYARWKITE